MVKGISRQVVLVRPSEPKLFEQAIFILRSDLSSEGISDEMLLREATLASQQKDKRFLLSGFLWACGGSVCTGLIWLLCWLL